VTSAFKVKSEDFAFGSRAWESMEFEEVCICSFALDRNGALN